MPLTSGSSTRSRPPRRRKPSASAPARMAHSQRQGIVGPSRRSDSPIECQNGPRFQLGTVRGQSQCEFVRTLLLASVRARLQRSSLQPPEKLGRRRVRGGGMHAGCAGDTRGTLGGVLDGPYRLGRVTTDPSSITHLKKIIRKRINRRRKAKIMGIPMTILSFWYIKS